jgi:hypothetical protein
MFGLHYLTTNIPPIRRFPYLYEVAFARNPEDEDFPKAKITRKMASTLYDSKLDYRTIMSILPEDMWDVVELKMKFVQEHFRSLGQNQLNEIRRELRHSPREPLIAKLLIDSHYPFDDLSGHVLWGIDWNHYTEYYHLTFIKLLNGNYRHYGLNYSKAKYFKDPQPFRPQWSRGAGGMHFTLNEKENETYWKVFDYKWKTVIRIPETAVVFLETKDPRSRWKFKTNEMYLSERIVALS